MKKLLSIFILFTLFVFTGLKANANEASEAEAFFNNYVQAANSYNPSLTKMYSPSAKIIRQVVKPNGTTANVYTNTATYIKQMKLSQGTAKIRHYKNHYSNVSVTKVGNDKYKISSLRQPSGENYKLKTYMIVEKQSNEKWLIVEEMMQTKVQALLRYAK